MTRPNLTKRQRAVLDFIIAFAEVKGKMPTLDEICEYIGSRTRSLASKYVDQLERKGYVRRGEPYTGRSMSIVGYEFRLVRI